MQCDAMHLCYATMPWLRCPCLDLVRRSSPGTGVPHGNGGKTRKGPQRAMRAWRTNNNGSSRRARRTAVLMSNVHLPKLCLRAARYEVFEVHCVYPAELPVAPVPYDRMYLAGLSREHSECCAEHVLQAGKHRLQ